MLGPCLITVDQETAARIAAALISSRLRLAVHLLGEATLALGCGSSMSRLYELLAREQLPWQAVTVHQVDERLDGETAGTHRQQLEQTFLAAFPEHCRPAARLFDAPAGAYADAAGPQQEDRSPRLDVAVLGLGADGNTASLFRNDAPAIHRDLSRAGAPTVRTTRSPDGQRRLTLSAAVLRNADYRIFLASAGRRRRP